MHVLTTAENRFIIRGFLGSLAQLVEQRTFNPLVPRSSRGRPTKTKKPAFRDRLFCISLPS